MSDPTRWTWYERALQRHRQTSDRPWNDERLRRAFSVVLVLSLVALVIALRRWNLLPETDSIGYFGVFLLSLMGSASILIPIPGIAAVCAGASLLGLFPLWVAIVASVAEALGELSGYLLGYSGRGIAQNVRIYPRVERWMERQGWLALLLASSIPNPLFDLIGVAAGTLRYPVPQFLVSVWAGKLIKSMTIAYACFYGIELVPRFFNIGL